MARLLALWRLEWRLLAAQRGLLPALALLAIGVATLYVVQARQIEREHLRMVAHADAMLDAWRTQAPKNAHLAAHLGTWALRPPAPLQALEPGVADHVGAAVFIEGHRRNTETMSGSELAQRSGADRVLGAAEAVRQVLAPILLVLAIALGRREVARFVVDPLASIGARPASVLGVRAALLSIVALAMLGPLALAAFWLGHLDAAFAAWAAATAVLLCTVCCFGLALGRAAGPRPGAVAAGVMAWLLFALVLPRVGATAAAVATPTSRAAFAEGVAAALQDQLDGHARSGATDRFKVDLLRQYGVDSLDALPVNADALLMQAEEDARAGVYAARIAALRERFARQERIMAALALASPVLAHERIGTALAGTDRAALDAWSDAVEQYRLAWVRRLNEDMAVHTRTGDWQSPASAALFEGTEPVPRPARSAAEAIRQGAGAWSAAAAWLTVGLAALLLAARARGGGPGR